jgi:hypothetical protein
MSRKRKAEPVTRADTGHPTPPVPHPVGRKKARRPAEPPPAPPLTTEAHHVVSKGIQCPRCGCHRWKALYTRYRAGAIVRVRRCRNRKCGHRIRTIERVESFSS